MSADHLSYSRENASSQLMHPETTDRGCGITLIQWRPDAAATTVGSAPQSAGSTARILHYPVANVMPGDGTIDGQHPVCGVLVEARVDDRVEVVQTFRSKHMGTSLRLVAICFDAQDPAPLAAFWAGMLDRTIITEASGARLPGDDLQVGLRFVQADTEDTGPNRVHLHLTSSTLEHQQHTVERALELGGRHIDMGQCPEEGHVVLADPGGNAFCVIEPGNNYLAGCGFLGEFTCEGPREVGLFWSAALGWPLVWDHDPQTAVQSPIGGTKISWDVRPGSPRYGSRRQRLELVASDPAGDVERLVALGATELGHRDGYIALADPDGGEFLVSRG